MSRSKREPIIKDKGICRSDYWQRVRSAQKNEIRKIPKNIDVTWICVDDDLTEQLTPKTKNRREIVNDWDRCDYVFRDCDIKYSRK